MITQPEGRNGFALAEAIVALAIVAAMSALLFEIIATRAAAVRKLEAQREALLIAQSVLATAGNSGPAQAEQESGTEDGFVWKVARASYETEGRAEGVALQQVAVLVSLPGDQLPLVRLSTLRAAR